jgi:Methyltransferase domain
MNADKTSRRWTQMSADALGIVSISSTIVSARAVSRSASQNEIHAASLSLYLRTVLICVICALFAGNAAAQQPPPQQPPPQPYVPEVGQAGKDVIWVPTPPELIERMLDVAKVTPADFVVDLGSGDGRMVIAAAKRGARALGVEFNSDMVELSRRLAAEAGVADKAAFTQGDMFEADFSKATVLALFLLPRNLEQLRPKMQSLPPGSRIVLNTFSIPGWDPDLTEQMPGPCASWCTVHLYVVRARE